MKTGGTFGICSLAGILLSASAYAASPVTPSTSPAGTAELTPTARPPYGEIVERNVFNLHAPSPPPNPEDLIKATPPPKLTLTGITTILGRKLVFLTMPPVKPGTPPESIMLAEGQAQNEVEVRSIDEKAGVVKVSNHGQDQTLDFIHNGATPQPGAPGGGMPPGVNGFPPPSMPPPNVMSLPQPGNVVRPIRNLQPRGNPFNSSGAARPMSREEQVALLEIQRARMQQEGDPAVSIMPPTEMTEEAQGQAPQ